MTPQEIRALLDEPHIGVLSTIDKDGYPHSVGIYYAPVDGSEGLELWMWVYGKSQKVRNVEREPRSAVLVEVGEPYADLRGVLVRGRARIERDFEVVFDLGKKMYERYFFSRVGVPFEEGPNAGIEAQSRKRVCLVLTVERYASWDHARGGSSVLSPREVL
jgi:PPOX class probable F420-dependent enzyme